MEKEGDWEGCMKSLNLPMVGLFYRHFSMESVPDPYVITDVPHPLKNRKVTVIM